MPSSTPRTPARKIKKTPTEIAPEVKLQEPRNHKKYDRNSGNFWLGASLRIIFVVGLVLGSFVLGVRMGFGEFVGALRQGTPVQRVDSMIEHCKLMPDMVGCEAYGTGANQGEKPHDMMDMSMQDMGKMLEGKTGSELDRAFLEAMIPHHQGAVDMAVYLTGALHPELRKMGEAIIKAQKKEIEQMQKWQKEWGYTGTITTPTPVDKIAL